MNEDAESRLRVRLARLTGAARTRPLVELAQILADRYWRAGPGKPAGLPILDEVIACLDEAYGHLSRNDPMRAQIGSQLGVYLGARDTGHRGSDSDRQRAITLLEEALDAPNMPPLLPSFARFNLGQLLLSTSVLGLRSLDISVLTGGRPLPGAAEAARAADCFREVAAADMMGTEMAGATQAMLTMAETVYEFLTGSGQASGAGDFDLEPIMRVITKMQELHRWMSGGSGGGLLFDLRTAFTEDPLDRPVTVVRMPDPLPDEDDAATGPTAVPRHGTRPGAPDVEALRRAIGERVAGGGDSYAALSALLRPGTPPPAVGLVDDLVGLATSVTHLAGANATAADQVMLAVVRYLRGRNDADDGWDDADADARSAAAHLLAAADALPAERSGVVPLAVELAEHLGGPVRDSVHARFAPVAEALRAVRVAALAWPRADETLLLRAETGRFDRVPAGRALPDRVVVVGTGPVPDDDAVVVSHVASARQAAELAARMPMRVTEAPVLVADPRGDRGTAEVERLRRLYPRSVVLGRVGSGADGAGTPDEVLAHLGASMLHLDCDVDADGSLALAGPAELTPAVIAGRAGHAGAEGGLAVLPPVGAGSGPLTDALLTAGFTAVVAWVRPVPRPVAALMLTLLHTELVRGGLRPAAAVRAVGRRLRDPTRIGPAHLPPALTGRTALDLTDPAYRTAMVLRGL